MKKVIYILMFLAFAFSISAQTSWLSQTNPLTGVQLVQIKFVSATEGWITASNGKLLHTTNGGNNWLIVTPEPIDTLYASGDGGINMSFVSPTTGWIIYTKLTSSQPNGAVVYKTTNSGVNWNKLTIPSYQAGFFIRFVDANYGCIMLINLSQNTTGIFRTTNGGTNWDALSTPVTGYPYFINANTGWLVPQNFVSPGFTSDTLRKTTDGGTTWTAPWGTNTQVRLTAMHFSDIINGWQVGNYGNVLKTTNGGTSWNYITNIGLTTDYKCRDVYFLNANTGWICTENGSNNNVYVLYTNNSGTSWTWQTPPVSNLLKSISFFDALHGGLIANNGGSGLICNTTNGGVWVKSISSEVPSSYSLSQNYPNPFNPTTNIKFQIKNAGVVKLVVFDLLGKEVATLVNEKLAPGTYEATFDASKYSSGVYFYRLETQSYKDTKKMILIK